MLLNITGGYDLGMHEVNDAADMIHQEADEDAIIIFGSAIKEDLQDELVVTVIATGFEEHSEIFTPGHGIDEMPAPQQAPTEDDSSADGGTIGIATNIFKNTPDRLREEPAPAPRAENLFSEDSGTKATSFEIPDFLKG